MSRCLFNKSTRRILAVLLAGIFPSIFAARVDAAVISSSVDDFSDQQGSSGWSYGAFVGGNGAYSTGAFIELDVFDNASSGWIASNTLLAGGNNAFLSVRESIMHPAGLLSGGESDTTWAVRRYQSAVQAEVDLVFRLRKSNATNILGGGITGRIFLDGVEIFTELVPNDDDAPGENILTVMLEVGSILDFAVDPLGEPPQAGGDSIFSARADGTEFTVLIRDAIPAPVPLPASAGMLLLGLTVLALRRAKQSGTRR